MSRLRSYLIGSHSAGPVGDFGLLLLRVFAGLALAFGHGLGKLPSAQGFIGMIGGFGFPMPELFAWSSGIAETIGGILLAAGLLTRPAATFIVVNMAVAVIFAHAGDAFGDRELPMMFGFIAAMFALVGAGRYSLDAVLRRRP